MDMRLFFGALSITLLVLSSLIAFLQAPHPRPFDPIPSSDWRRWLKPVEQNIFQRFAMSAGTPSAQLFGARDGSVLWIVTEKFFLSSTDAGETWERRRLPDENVTIDGDTLAFELHALATARSGVVIVAVGSNGYIIQVSEDSGATWQVVHGAPNPFDATLGQPDKYRQTLSAVAVSQDAGRAVAAGSLGVILVSQGVADWQFDLSGDTRWPIREMAMSGDGMTTAMVGGSVIRQDRDLPGQITLSTDGGETWKTVDIGADLNLRLNPYSVAISGDGRGILVAGRTDPRDPPAVLRSVDGGANWAPAHVGEPVASPVAGSVAVAADPAARFLKSVALADNAVALAAGQDESGGSGSLYRSDDFGATWTPVGLAPDFAPIVSVYISANGALALAATTSGQILRSYDGGREWELAAVYSRHPALWYYAALAVSALFLVLAIRPVRVGPQGATSADHYQNDAPIVGAEADRLNFTRIAQGLSHFLRNKNTDPPLTLAITGEWGSGKSSLMRILQRDLEGNGFSTVWFNAWHHQTEEGLLAALLEAIRQHGVPSLWSMTGLMFRCRLLWTRLRRDIRNYSLGLVLFVAAGVALSRFATGDSFSQLARNLLSEDGEPPQWLRLMEHYVSETNWPVDSIVTLILMIVAIVWVLTHLKTIKINPAHLLRSAGARVRISQLQASLSVRHRFAQEFKDVTEALHPFSTLVIVIDDLDRCRPDSILEILESVNFLVSAGKCIVIFGMEFAPVLSSIEKYLEEFDFDDNTAEDGDAEAGDAKARKSRLALRYLEKLINIDVPVPKIDEAGIARILASQAEPREAALGNQTGMFRPGAVWRAFSDTLFWLGAIGFAALIGIGIHAQIDSIAGAILRASACPPDSEIECWIGESPLLQPPPAAAPPEGDDGSALPAPGDFDAHARNEEDSRRRTDTIEIDPPGYPERLAAHPVGSYILPFAMLAFGAVGLGVIGRWRSNRTEDSEELTEAMAIWAPVSDALSRTPRAVKRYQNRVRFMAIRQEREFGDRGGLTEQMLVALGALQFVDPKIGEAENFSHIFTQRGNLRRRRDMPDELREPKIQKALKLFMEKAVAAGKDRKHWPPSKDQLRTFSFISSGYQFRR